MFNWIDCKILMILNVYIDDRFFFHDVIEIVIKLNK